MHRWVLCIAADVLLRPAQGLRTQPSQGVGQLASHGHSGEHQNVQEARSDLDFLGGILGGAYGSSARGAVSAAASEGGLRTVSPTRRVDPPRQLPTPSGEPSAGATALSRTLRAGVSSVGYLDDLVHRAKEAHARAFARTSNILNVTSAGLGYLDGLARSLKELYATREVLNSTHDDSVAALWAGYQEELASAVQSAHPPRPGAFRVLVVSPVAGDERAVSTFAYNLERLRANAAGDVFRFALFHYDGNTTLWERAPWYSGRESPVVLRSSALCKGHAWAAVTPEMASGYDYVWLMDGDLQLDYFSWDLYHSLLAALDPLVSQPAVLARDGGERSTDIGQLRMAGLEQGAFPVAREVNRSEGMAALLSARLWPAVHERLGGNDPRTIWYATDFWDAAADAAALACGRTGVLLINASPVRHLNRHDLLAPGSVGEAHNCTKGCGEEDANCRPMSDSERRLIAEGLRGVCAVPPDSPYLACESGNIRQCQVDLASEHRRRQWAMLREGRLTAMRYRCNASSAGTANADPCNVTAVWPD